jgi:tetratricopeptide (TPR) repeat protein
VTKYWARDKLQRFADGVDTLAELEGIGPDKLYGMSKFAHLLMAQGKVKEAQMMFAGLIALNPYDPYAYMALGVISARQGDWEAAERFSSRALETSHSLMPARLNRAEARIKLGKAALAIEDLAELAKLDTGNDPFAARARAILKPLTHS